MEVQIRGMPDSLQRLAILLLGKTEPLELRMKHVL